MLSSPLPAPPASSALSFATARRRPAVLRAGRSLWGNAWSDLQDFEGLGTEPPAQPPSRNAGPSAGGCQKPSRSNRVPFRSQGPIAIQTRPHWPKRRQRSSCRACREVLAWWPFTTRTFLKCRHQTASWRLLTSGPPVPVMQSVLSRILTWRPTPRTGALIRAPR